MAAVITDTVAAAEEDGAADVEATEGDSKLQTDTERPMVTDSAAAQCLMATELPTAMV